MLFIAWQAIEAVTNYVIIKLGTRCPQLRLYLSVEVSQQSKLALSLRKGLVSYVQIWYPKINLKNLVIEFLKE